MIITIIIIITTIVIFPFSIITSIIAKHIYIYIYIHIHMIYIQVCHILHSYVC